MGEDKGREEDASEQVSAPPTPSCHQLSPSAQRWAAAPAHREKGAHLLTHSPFHSATPPHPCYGFQLLLISSDLYLDRVPRVFALPMSH